VIFLRVRQLNGRGVRGGLIEGLESVAREAKRDANYANNGLAITWKNVLEGVDQPSATCLTKTESKSVDDA